MDEDHPAPLPSQGGGEGEGIEAPQADGEELGRRRQAAESASGQDGWRFRSWRSVLELIIGSTRQLIEGKGHEALRGLESIGHVGGADGDRLVQVGRSRQRRQPIGRPEQAVLLDRKAVRGWEPQTPFRAIGLR